MPAVKRSQLKLKGSLRKGLSGIACSTITSISLTLVLLGLGLLAPTQSQTLNGGVDRTELNGTTNGQNLPGLQGSVGTDQGDKVLKDSASQRTLQGSASTVQTRLVRPSLTGAADANALNGDAGRVGAPIDFAKAFPTVDPNVGRSTRLSGGSNSDLGIIGEISITTAPHIVTRVFSPSPAAEAGMMAGDVLLTADGREAIPRNIIGLPGTSVTIVWSHRGEIRTSVLVRREAGLIPMESAFKQQYLQEVGGYARNFGAGW